jgi:hypothetical protein
MYFVGRAVPDNESLSAVGHSPTYQRADNESLSAVGHSPTYKRNP